jgi:alginate O-acetyltransferase complex protein AlgI
MSAVRIGARGQLVSLITAMLFNSFLFLFVFLPIVLVVYFSLKHKQQNIFLVLASCVFYASWDWRFIFPLLLTTGLDYYIAHRLQALPVNEINLQSRKRLVTISIVSNLLLLGFFKYFNFFIDNFNGLLLAIGVESDLRVLEIILPVAISFYTFQAMSYTIDVYRGKFQAKESFWDFFLAVLYFPHLVAGPIQRAASLIPQVTKPRIISQEKISEGIHLVIWGLFKKVFIADNLAPLANSVFALPSPTGGEVLVGVLAFTFQIYCDFSGYTDIARGLAKIMGFEFQLNFNLPYFARNPSEFWRRWHISLSEWLRDYLYKPLGGSIGSNWLTYRNLLLTMLLGGLWHGAAWNFVTWGLFHGAILVLHRLVAQYLELIRLSFRIPTRVWGLLCVVGMFLLTLYGWLLFRAASLEQIKYMTAALANPLESLDLDSLRIISVHVFPLLLVQIHQARSADLFFLRNVTATPRVVTYALMVYLMVFYGGEPESFVYFQF